MLAFHNDQKVKDFYLARVIKHQQMDEIIKGQYWQKCDDNKFRGCAVGCTLHGSDHKDYETELGIPLILARLEDEIFENLPNNRSKTWPAEFLSSIKVGSDLINVWPQFADWLLTDEIHGVLQYAKSPDLKKIIKTIADYYSRRTEITQEQWKYASDAAYAAASVGDVSAVDYAAYAAASIGDVSAAAHSAYAAASSASHAASHAASAAYANYDYASAAAYAARKKHRTAQADKLLELLANA